MLADGALKPTALSSGRESPPLRPSVSSSIRNDVRHGPALLLGPQVLIQAPPSSS